MLTATTNSSFPSLNVNDSSTMTSTVMHSNDGVDATLLNQSTSTFSTVPPPATNSPTTTPWYSSLGEALLPMFSWNTRVIRTLSCSSNVLMFGVQYSIVQIAYRIYHSFWSVTRSEDTFALLFYERTVKHTHLTRWKQRQQPWWSRLLTIKYIE